MSKRKEAVSGRTILVGTLIVLAAGFIGAFSVAYIFGGQGVMAAIGIAGGSVAVLAASAAAVAEMTGVNLRTLVEDEPRSPTTEDLGCVGPVLDQPLENLRERSVQAASKVRSITANPRLVWLVMSKMAAFDEPALVEEIARRAGANYFLTRDTIVGLDRLGLAELTVADKCRLTDLGTQTEQELRSQM